MRKSFRSDRQSVFFTAVNPMYARQDLEGVEYDLDKPRIAPYEHTWKAHHISILVQFEACSEEGIAVLSNSITCNRSFQHTDSTVVCMKIGEELYCKVHQSPRLPRVTLMPNSQHDQKDVLITDSRNSDDCENEVHEHRETCTSSRVDFRIPGIPHSTVEQVETNRKESL